MPAYKNSSRIISETNINERRINDYDRLHVVDLENNLEPSILTPDYKKPISHLNTRLFRPDKLSLPRNFQRPQFITNSTLIDPVNDTPTDALNGQALLKNNDLENSALQSTALFLESNINQRHKDTKHVLSRKSPLIVEIGAGKGKHACLYARQNPHHNVIAIERTTNKFAAFYQTLNQAKLPNLLAVHADAIPYSVFALPAYSIDTVYILYPNPELKNPNQQWLNMPFFEFLLSRIKPKGKIVLASNIKDYIDNAYSKSIAIWQLASRKYKVPSTSARTHFEIKYLQRGEICWEIEMIKPAHYLTHFDNWQAMT